MMLQKRRRRKRKRKKVANYIDRAYSAGYNIVFP